ncbi:TonB-dependent siderophore receptor [Dechloromonas sp. XY25]|uniref:TonB-dependent siderophore receptor n=1 Tax=Dechloromonas hankyongensis TaxID=2908002 RepID=A0ABS9K7G0_9RHOO|nr:TonB-dependent siderophore receptor [Dechloromonas hankyongensis]MCG2579081.1 TonB-dependent siderophore receptor [Dechloromonas hankyongensis]
MKNQKEPGRIAHSPRVFSNVRYAEQPTARRLPVAAAVVAALLGIGNAALAEEDKTLSAVTVTATQDQPDGHRATKTRVGKVVQDPHDVPQAITTVTRALIEEQEANSLREALRNVSGLSFNAAEGGRSGDNMNLRGFYTFGDMYLDGIRDTAQYNRELFNLEQVDVLRGAAAMLFGRGQAGGVINQVSKTPMLYGINKAGFGVGTHGFQEIRADLNQRIGDTTAFRINLMNRDEGSARSNPYTGAEPEIHRMGFAPSIAFGLGTNHEVTLSHYWLKTQDKADYGVPFSGKRPDENAAKSGYYWGTDSNFDDSETNVSTFNYLYKISPDTQWRTVLRAANYKRAYWAVAPQGALTAASLASLAKTRQFETQNYVLQSDLNTAFTLFGMKNELITGVEYLNEDSIRWALRNLGTATNPLYKPGQFTTAAPATYKGETYSAYVQDTVEFVPDWKLTLGVRRDIMQSEYFTTTAFSGNFGENSYRAGLSWQPTAAQHYYAGWSDSFSPTADLYQLSGNQFPAERSKVIEVGSKWLLADGNLSLRTSLYRAVKDWERNTDLESTATILTRKRQSDGVELEAAGRITDNWEVFSGLSYIHAEILEVAPNNGNPNFIGQMPRNTPKKTFNLWTTYQLPYGFKVGGGMEYKSRRYGGAPTGTAAFNPNWVDSYVRWDAMVAYDQPKYTVKFNVQNIFDKVYYDALYDNGGFTVPGQARRFILSTEYKF